VTLLRGPIAGNAAYREQDQRSARWPTLHKARPVCGTAPGTDQLDLLGSVPMSAAGCRSSRPSVRTHGRSSDPVPRPVDHLECSLSTYLSSNAVAIQVEMVMPNRSSFKYSRLRLRGASDLEEFVPDRQPIFGRTPSDGHPIEPTRLSSRSDQGRGRVDFRVSLWPSTSKTTQFPDEGIRAVEASGRGGASDVGRGNERATREIRG